MGMGRGQAGMSAPRLGKAGDARILLGQGLMALGWAEMGSWAMGKEY